MTEMYTKEWFWEKFDSKELCEEYSNYFETWWDSEKFDWFYVNRLIKNCSKYISIWWDPSKITNWKSASLNLPIYCSEYIDIWWDSEKFDWFRGVEYLITNCSNDKKQFKIWWNPNKFNWVFDFKLLLQYCIKEDIFEIWWNPKICWMYCTTPRAIDKLYARCIKYKKIWNPKV